MARREVTISLTDSEVAALLYYVEEGLLELQDGKVDPKDAQQGNKLQEKLNAALNEFATPEEQDPDMIICYFMRRELQTITEMVSELYENDPFLRLDDDGRHSVKHLLTKLRGILRQGF
jgi:hypothetical protein